MFALFQSTPLREGRQGKGANSATQGGFNPRPCERGDCAHRRIATAPFRSFNPRPCERGDYATAAVEAAKKVSIHAPARGATLWLQLCNQKQEVSIHAPARGATRRGIFCRRTQHVSIHAPARGATSWNGRWGGEDRVSIHAPARGATPPRLTFSPRTLFQSTPLREGRLIWDCPLMLRDMFQSTPLREGRPHGYSNRAARRGFNPRPCERGDKL